MCIFVPKIKELFKKLKFIDMKKLFIIVAVTMCCQVSFGQLKVTPNGNVGIGNNNPLQKLQVDTGSILLRGMGGNLFFANGAPSCLTWGIEYTDGACYGNAPGLNFWRPWTAAPCEHNYRNYVLFLHDRGNVGIGCIPSEGYALDVRGISRVPTLKIFSDERLKTEIRPIDLNETANLYLLQGNFYKKTLPAVIENFTCSSDVKPSVSENPAIEILEYGYLAQELEAFFPNLVSIDDEGYYSVDYIGLIPITIEAVKEQKSTLDNQQQEVTQLQTEFARYIDSIEQHRREIETLQQIVMFQEMDLGELRNDINMLWNEVMELRFDLNRCCEGKGLLRGDTLYKDTSISKNPIFDKSALYQNTPNPFNANTQISYYLPTTVQTAYLYIYSLNGIQQKSYFLTQRGAQAITIYASELPAGMYLYTLVVDNEIIDTKRMILTK